MYNLVTYMREPKFQFYDDLCDAMVSTILTFPPPLGPVPASPQPDDKGRIMNQYTRFNDPQMLELFDSVDDHTRNVVNATVDMLHKRFQVFPSSFWIWDTLPGHNLTVRGA
jgi:hypothetical protein